MNWIISRITGNPMVLMYVAAICFVVGSAFGGYLAWTYEDALKDAVQARYDSFVAQVKTIGVAAEKAASDKAAQDKLDKERYDEQNKNELADAAEFAKRLYDARAGRSYLPAPTPAASHPDRVCFDRAKFESAMGRLDEGGSRIANQGTGDGIKLDTAKSWVKTR